MNCKAWDNIRVFTSHNRNEYYEPSQYGGTATISLGTITGTIHDTGQDPTGLGRWSYITYLGRNGLSSCVISAYNPCKTKITAPQTVYAQHSRYFLNNNIDTCPCEMFRKDLSDFIVSLEKEKIQIILCIDLNEDFTRNNGPLYQTLTTQNNLVNILCHIHPHLPPPATNNRGSRPIDTIMVSQKIKTTLRQTGYPSDLE
jgi:hypothetical protein